MPLETEGEPDFGTDRNGYGCFVPDLTRFAAQCMRRGPPEGSLTEGICMVGVVHAV